MGKFPFKRPRIISKHFPELNPHVDRVTKSLEGLVFSYSEHVERTLQKKHLMMAISSMALLIVLGSFLSPKGVADSSVFYPSSCLGGWINPKNAQGEIETTSNGDETQFTITNSAILPKNTNAELYCGDFKGNLKAGTKPTKVIVSLALTKGADVLLEDTIQNESFASSTLEILDTSSATDLSFTLATSTASSTLEISTSTVVEASSSTEIIPTDASTTPSIVTATSLPPENIPSPSVLEGIIESVRDAVDTVVEVFTTPEQATTDTVIIPAPEPTDASTSPQSFLQKNSTLASLTSSLVAMVKSALVLTVFAQTGDEVSTTSVPDPVPVTIPVPQTEEVEVTVDTTENPVTDVSTPSTLENLATSTDEFSISTDSLETISESTSTLASTTMLELATTTMPELATSTISESVSIVNDENQFQNNFLEVFYTTDGVTWTSLGELNEVSMKYRTFEIPVTASTTWQDITSLQIKLISKKHIDDTPTLYLDGVKIEVLHEAVVLRGHPDFSRDVILNDKSSDGIRVVNIITSDTNEQQIWYTTVQSQEGYGVAPGTWVQAALGGDTSSYKLIDIYGQNIFWLDETENLLWVTNLQNESNDGINLLSEGSTTIGFIKANGEEWVFEYNASSTEDSVYIKK